MFAVTDGHDNSSHKCNQQQLNKIIGEKPNGWSFVFLSADMGEVREASHMNIKVDDALMVHKFRQGNNDAWV